MFRWVALVFSVCVWALGALGAIAEAQPRRRAPAAAPRAQERVCVPGAQMGCDCPNGGRGVQVCSADGMGLDPCRCLPAPGSVEAAPFAAPPPVAPAVVVRPREPAYVTRWYGWQPLLVDVGAAGVSLAGTAAESPPVQLVGGIMSLLGAPIVHMVHGRFGAAGASALARLSVLGCTAVALTADDRDQQQGFLVLSGVLHVLAVTADAWWLSMERVPRAQVSPAAGITGGGVLALRGGAALVVGGAF